MQSRNETDATPFPSMAGYTPDRYGLSRQEQNRFSWQQAVLVSRATLDFGLTGIGTAAICMFIPGPMPTEGRVVVGVLLILLLAAHIALRIRQSALLMVLVFSLGMTTVMTMVFGLNGVHDTTTLIAIAGILGWGIGGLGAVMLSSWGKLVALGAALATTLTLLALICHFAGSRQTIALILMVVVAWGICATVGLWLSDSFGDMFRRVASIGAAYSLERHTSEIEAQRHSDARLLHDTVLATLTLLAHSGRGVDESALRSQARADAELLRRLRLGENPEPATSGGYALTGTAELPLGATLAALRTRFDAIGLTIEWHGTSQLLLPQQRLRALILALRECLENVRRHSGTTLAHVTLSDDGVTIRAVVTDAGVGFTPCTTTGGLGFRESVVGRIEDAGGTVRVFSAPGAGTTVVLEMPK